MNQQEPVSGPRNDEVASVPDLTLQRPEKGTQPRYEGTAMSTRLSEQELRAIAAWKKRFTRD